MGGAPSRPAQAAAPQDPPKRKRAPRTKKNKPAKTNNANDNTDNNNDDPNRNKNNNDDPNRNKNNNDKNIRGSPSIQLKRIVELVCDKKNEHEALDQENTKKLLKKIRRLSFMKEGT